MSFAREIINTLEALDLETEAKRNIARIKRAIKVGKISKELGEETIAYWRDQIALAKRSEKELVGSKVSRPDQAVIRRRKK